jgi:hypothetical protein
MWCFLSVVLHRLKTYRIASAPSIAHGSLAALASGRIVGKSKFQYRSRMILGGIAFSASFFCFLLERREGKGEK